MTKIGRFRARAIDHSVLFSNVGSLFFSVVDLEEMAIAGNLVVCKTASIAYLYIPDKRTFLN